MIIMSERINSVVQIYINMHHRQRAPQKLDARAPLKWR